MTKADNIRMMLFSINEFSLYYNSYITVLLHGEAYISCHEALTASLQMAMRRCRACVPAWLSYGISRRTCRYSFTVFMVQVTEKYLTFAEDKLRFGNIKPEETPFLRLAVALTLHYLCRR